MNISCFLRPLSFSRVFLSFLQTDLMCLTRVLARDRNLCLEARKSVSDKVDNVWRLIESESNKTVSSQTDIDSEAIAEDPTLIAASAIIAEAVPPEIMEKKSSK